MTIPKFDDVKDLPLDTPERVRERIAQTVGRALRDQVWLLLLDDELRQLPVLLPVEDMPDLPSTDALAGLMEHLRVELDVRSLVVVIERPGRRSLTATDRARLRAFDAAFERTGLECGGFLLSSAGGVRTLARADWE